MNNYYQIFEILSYNNQKYVYLNACNYPLKNGTLDGTNKVAAWTEFFCKVIPDLGYEVDEQHGFYFEYYLPIGSEGGNYMFASAITIAEGIFVPVIGWDDPDMSDRESPYYLGRYWTPEEPEISFKTVPLKDEYVCLYYDPSFKLPLYEAVFHDSVITSVHVGFSSLKFSNVEKTNAITEILYQVPSVYHLNLDTLEENKNKIKAQSEIFGETHKYSYNYVMQDFQYLTDDRSVQMSTFGKLVLIANYSADNYTFNDTDIPSNSILIINDGLFSPLELRVYKLHNPNYDGDVLTLKLDKFLKRTSFPPSVYMCYSSDPLGNEEIKYSTKIVLKKLFQHNVNILFITKGVFDDSIIDIIKLRPDLMNVQVDLSSCDDRRNKIVEPGAPTYRERLINIEKLSKIDGLASLVIRMDPLLPDIDDKDENIIKILHDIRNLGVKEVVTGYIILTHNMKNSWEKNEFTKIATKALTEKTPTISHQELFSIPFEEKMKRINHIRQICENMGMNLSVCGCKDERFKQTEIEWICHPFNRKRREELNKKAPSGMIMETDHLI